MKFCKKCNIEKEYKLFPIRNDSKDGYRNECIDCTKIYRDSKNIIPISSANNQADIIKLNHHSNLQPLCSKVNRDIKKDKIDYEYV